MISQEIKSIAVTPTVNHLFQIREKNIASFSPEKQADAFNHTLMQFLFMPTQAKMNIQKAVAFLKQG